MSSGVYAIVHVATSRSYIGSSKSIEHRWREHKRLLAISQHHCQHLQRAWAKYGSDAFDLRVIEHVSDLSLLKEREQWYIDSGLPIYNSWTIATRGPGMTGRKHTPTAKVRVSTGVAEAWTRGAYANRPPNSVETLEKIRASRAKQPGRKWTPVERQMLSVANKNRKPWLRQPHSQDTKDKISAAMHGRPKTNQHKANMRVAALHRQQRGTPHAEAGKSDT